MSIINYTKLMRFKTSFLIGVSSLLGVSFYLSDNVNLTENLLQEPTIIILLKIIAVFLLLVLSSGALNLFNDIIDLKIDQELKPERILAQGIVSIKRAYIFFVLCFSTGLVLGWFINLKVLAIYLIMFAVGVFYSLFFQNIPLVKNIIVAFSISMAILVGYLALTMSNAFDLSNKMITIFFLSLFSIISFELQKDINDVEVDKKYDKKTFPVVFGKKRSSVLVYILYWFLVLVLWLYLIFNFIAGIYLIIILIIIQSYVLYSIRNIIFDQSFEIMERARIRIYFLFAITLFTLFIV